MKRLLMSSRLATAIGVVVGMQGVLAGSCSAHGLCWWCCCQAPPQGGTSYTTTTTRSTTPISPTPAPTGTVQPTGGVLPPTLGQPSSATPQSALAPGVIPAAAPAPAAAPGSSGAASYSAAPGYYFTGYYTSGSYVAPASYAAPASAPAAAPLAPASYLATFRPDAQAAPAPYEAAPSQHARGQAILNGLRATVAGNRGVLFGTLLQTALNLFVQQFGFSPNNQDYSMLTHLVERVLNEASSNLGGFGGGTVPGVNPAVIPIPVTPGPSTPVVGAQAQGPVLTIKVEAIGPNGTLQTVSQVTVSIGGMPAGARAPGSAEDATPLPPTPAAPPTQATPNRSPTT